MSDVKKIKITGLGEYDIKTINDHTHPNKEILDSITNIANPAYIGENGNWFTYNIETNSYVDSGIAAKGDKGDKGDDGDSSNFNSNLISNILTNSISIDTSNSSNIDYNTLCPNIGSVGALEVKCETSTLENIMAPSNTAKENFTLVNTGLIGITNSGEFTTWSYKAKAIAAKANHYYYVCIATNTEMTTEVIAGTNQIICYDSTNTSSYKTGTVSRDTVNKCIYGVVKTPLTTDGTIFIGIRNMSGNDTTLSLISEIVIDIGTDIMTPDAAYEKYGSEYFVTKSLNNQFTLEHIVGNNTIYQKSYNGEAMYVFTPENEGYLKVSGNNAISSINLMYGSDKRKQYCILKDGILTIIKKHNTTQDFYVTLKQKGVNNLFDFYEGGFIPNTSQDVSTSTQSKSTMFVNKNDWFGAFNMVAESNADGDVSPAPMTGGAHSTENTQEGTPTARSLSVNFWVDNMPVTNFEGYFDRVRVKWSNNVQAGNTVKSDGSGREVLTETHEIIFDGEKFNVFNDLMPLENVTIYTYYNFQACIKPGFNGTLNYMGGTNTNRLTLNSTENTESGALDTSIAISKLNGNCLELGLDTSFDLGTHNFVTTENSGMICDGSKIRTRLIINKSLSKDNHYYSRGYFKFFAE